MIPVDPNPTGEKELDAFFREDPEGRDWNKVRARQDIIGRHLLLNQVIDITYAWIGFLIVVTFLQMICRMFGAGLQESEFITIVTSTTASVLGLWIVVGVSLYPRKGPADSSQ